MKKIAFWSQIILWSAISSISFVSADPLDSKVEALLQQLTLEEKISMIHGNGYFTTPAIERLGIPALTLSDGPCGIREENNSSNWGSANWKNDSTAYFPSFTTLASTWNRNLAGQMGIAYGEEGKARHKIITLSPGINIHRTPLNGRNWEYMSEDPYLISQMVVPVIQGIQSNGIASCVKHFALNNQEKNRYSVNVEVDERTLREIYLPGFEAAVKDAGVMTVMGAYNKFRGQHASHNKYLLIDILKKEWGFKGLVISDWGATHNTMEAANNGLDLEMGTIKPDFDDFFMAHPLLDSIKAGKINITVIDDKVRRILRLMCSLNLIGTQPPDTTGMQSQLATPQRASVALKIAEEGAVLLKNKDQFLPFNIQNIKSIAVIGENAIRKQAHGGGSTIVKARYEVTPLEALKKMAGDKIKINFAKGYQSKPKKWGGYDPGADLVDKALLKEALTVAGKSDVVIFFGGLNHDLFLDSEGGDKLNMGLPYKQDSIISSIIKANPKTLVVLITGGPVEMGGWVDTIPALLETSYNGMEGGTALVNIIFGKVNPSGKLTDTWPFKLEDTPVAKFGEYPGRNGTVKYNEGIYVGYRYYDIKNVDPRYPFGYGLSYSSYEYSGLEVPKAFSIKQDSLGVTFSVKNTGQFPGKEIAQVYVSNPGCSIERPIKELKQFVKIDLLPGETKKINLTLNKRAFQYYDINKNSWVAEPGTFEILVGSSSRDIKLKAELKLN